MRRLLFLVIAAMGMFEGHSQTLVQTYTDRCTGEVKVFSVQMGGQTVVAYYNKSRVFTSTEFTNGTLQAWLEDTYAWYQALSPCSTGNATSQTTQQTTNQATQNATNAANNATSGTTGSTGTTGTTGTANTGSTNTGSTNTNTNGNTGSTSGSSGGQGSNSSSSGSNSSGGSGSSNSSGGDSGNTGNDNSGGNGSGDSGGDSGSSGGEGSSGGSGSDNDSGSSDSDNSSGDGNSSDGDSSGETEGDSGGEGEESKSDSKSDEDKKESGDEKSEKESEKEVEDEEKKDDDKSSEKDSEEESDEEKSSDEESEDEDEDEKQKKSDNEDEEEEDEDKKEKRLAPPIVTANLVTMQMMDGVLQQAASFGYSQSSLTGRETYSVNGMVWSNLQQFSINFSQSSVYFNYDKEVPIMVIDPISGKKFKFGSYKDQGTIMMVQSLSAGYMKMYSTHIATAGISNVYMGQKENFWKGFVGGFALTGIGVFLEGGEVVTTAALTAFGTKPFPIKDRLVISPMLAYSHSPFTYAFQAKTPIWTEYGTYIIGSNFDFKLSQRFNANIGGTVIGNTQPGIPMSYAITVGSRFAF